MAATAPAKKHSKFDKQEITQGLNQLYAPPSFDTDPKCVDIVVVPGLGSNMTHTWIWKDEKTQRRVHWLKDKEMLQKVIPKARITVFGYRSQWFGPDATNANLPTISGDLLESIKVDRADSKTKKRPIIFVGHSLGGLIIAKAVTKAKREPEDYPGIIDCITACVFLGTPFRGSDAQPIGKVVALAGETLGLAKNSSLIKALKHGVSELNDLPGEFLSDVDKARIDIQCYFEQNKTNGILVADEKSSTFEGKPKNAWDRDHGQMSKFEGGEKDENYKTLSLKLKEFAQRSFRTIKLRQDLLRQEVLNDSRSEKILEALEVGNPKRDLDKTRRISGIAKGAIATPSWMQGDKKYLTWRDELSSQTLLICGSPGKGKTLAAISMIEELSQLRDSDGDRDDSIVLAYFFCDEQDTERSNALNVLKSLAWQLLKSKRHLFRHFFKEDKASTQKVDSTEFDSLLELWKRLKAALSERSLGKVYFLVCGLDQVDSASRKEVMNLITSLRPRIQEDDNENSGPYLKWLFLSVHREDILEALQHEMILNLDDGSNSTAQDYALHEYVSERINELAKEKGYSRSLEYFIRSFISFRAKGKSNYDWVDLVCQELRSDEKQHIAIRPRLETLPSDLYPMYDQVSSRVLSASELEVECSKEILRSLLLVYSPPITLYELAVIAGLPEEDRMNLKAIKRHVNRCGALTTIIKDRVQLSHKSVRDFLRSKSNDWLAMGSEQIQHGIIALRCFEYVINTVKEAEVENLESLKEGAADDRENVEGDAANDQENVKEDESDQSSDDDDIDEWDWDDTDTEDEEDEMDDAGPVKSGHKKAAPEKQILRYPYTQWIEHALQSTADIVENFGIGDVFWVLGSRERAEWSKSYSKLNDPESGEFDAEFTALHVAAYFGYVPLADLLLKTSAHVEEIRATDSQGLQPLYWACRRGHMNMVQKLCKAGADVDYQQTFVEHGLTALHGAVMSEKSEITEYLLNHNAAVDVPNKYWGSALYIAADMKQLAMAQQLISKKSDPNLASGDEGNPLNAAAYSGSLEIVKLLVESGAEVNPTVEHKFGNALGVACWSGQKEIAEYLLQQNCDFKKIGAGGSRPLEIAAEYGHQEIVQLLLLHDLDPESHQKALLQAVEWEHIDCVRVLLEKCPQIDRSEAFKTAASNGYTEILKELASKNMGPEVLAKALYEATEYEHEEAVRQLLEMDANPDAEGEEYGNVLQVSAYIGNTEFLKLLLEKGAKPSLSYVGSEYGTALQAACFDGNIENVKLLIEYGASVNTEICGEYGTPLQAACAQGYTEIVQLLLEKGADPNAEGGPDGYAIIAATSSGHSDILELLVEHGAEVDIRSPEDGSTPLTNAAMELSKSSLELLINHGAPIHVRDDNGDTALIMAAASGDVERVLYLLEKGSDIRTIGKWGGALYRATEASAIDSMRVLLDHSIDVNQEGGDMHTPLQAAASLGEKESVDLLLVYNGDVNKVGGKFHTALQAAVSANSIEVAQLLLDRGADPNKHGGKHGTVLHAAIYADPNEFIDLLLEHGADINALAERGTPLQLACAILEIDHVTNLLDKGADPNIVGGRYGTALQAACFHLENEVAELLLEKGADPMLRGGCYGSALGAAAAKGAGTCLELLLDKYPTQGMVLEALHHAAHYREKHAVRDLLDHGVDVTAASRHYASAFEALDAELSPEERKQKNGDYDFWYGPYREDDEDDDDDDSSDEEGMPNDKKSENDGDEGSSDSIDGGNEEKDKEEEAEAQKEIKQMLEEALDSFRRDEQPDGELDQPTPLEQPLQTLCREIHGKPVAPTFTSALSVPLPEFEENYITAADSNRARELLIQQRVVDGKAKKTKKEEPFTSKEVNPVLDTVIANKINPATPGLVQALLHEGGDVSIARQKSKSIWKKVLRKDQQTRRSDVLAKATQNCSLEVVWILTQEADDIAKTEALPYAINENDTAKVRILLDSGANAEEFCMEFISAVENNADDMVEILLRAPKGPCPQCRTTGLVKAVNNGSLRNTLVLLEKGADADFQNAAALQRAISDGREELANHLTFCASKPSPKSLDAAVGLAHAKLANDAGKQHCMIDICLLGGARGSITDETLVQACKRGQNALIDILLTHGASVDHSAGAALQYAIQSKKPALVTTLLRGKPSLSTLATAIPVTTTLNDPVVALEIVDILLSAGLRGDSVSQTLITVIEHPISVFGDPEHLNLIQLLLEKGYANINFNGGNSICLAAAKGSTNILKLLFQHGPSVESLNAAFPLAMEVKLAGQKFKVVTMILYAGASGKIVDEALLASASTGKDGVELTSALLKKSSVNYQNGKALCNAINTCSLEQMQALMAGVPSKGSLEAAWTEADALQNDKFQYQAFQILLAVGVDESFKNNSLITAAKRGNRGLQVCTLLLKHQASPNYSDGASVVNAAKRLHLDTLKLLATLVTSAAVFSNAFDALTDAQDWLTPIGLDVVRLLLEYGASGPQVDAAFCKAARLYKTDALELLAKSINPGAVNVALATVTKAGKGWLSPDNSHLWLIHSLLEWGAGGDCVNIVLLEALDAYTHGFTSEVLIDTLLHVGAKADVNFQNGKAVQIAARYGDAALLEKLALCGATTETLSVAFAEAITTGLDENSLISLIDVLTNNKGAKFNPKIVPDGYQPSLFAGIASYPQSATLVKKLAEIGCDVESKIESFLYDDEQVDAEDVTPLAWALSGPNNRIASATIEALIEVKADPNFTANSSMATPLILAAKYSRNDLVRSLLKAKATVSSKDRFGRSALFYASRNGDLASVKALLQAESPLNDGSLQEAAKNLHSEVVEALVNGKHNPEFPSSNELHDGRSALQEMALMCDCTKGSTKLEETIKALVNGKANPLEKSRGKNALFLALDNANPVPITRALLNCVMPQHINSKENVYLEADPETGTKYYFSLTTYVSRGFSQGPEKHNEQLLKLLVDNGAVDRFHAEEGIEQPADAIGMPQEIIDAEEKRRAQEERSRKQKWEDQLNLLRKKQAAELQAEIEEAKQEERIFQDEELAQLKREQSELAHMQKLAQEDESNAALKTTLREKTDAQKQRALQSQLEFEEKQMARVAERKARTSQQDQELKLRFQEEANAQKLVLQARQDRLAAAASQQKSLTAQRLADTQGVVARRRLAIKEKQNEQVTRLTRGTTKEKHALYQAQTRELHAEGEKMKLKMLDKYFDGKQKYLTIVNG